MFCVTRKIVNFKKNVCYFNLLVLHTNPAYKFKIRFNIILHFDIEYF